MPPFFQPLTLARCDNRNAPSRERAEIAQMLAWFDAGNQAQGLHAVSFDFFIDWSSNRLQRVAWLKRATAPSLNMAEAGPNIAGPHVAAALAQDATFLRLAAFCQANALDLSAMVFDDQQNWSSAQSWLIEAHPGQSTRSEPTVATAALSMPDLKAQIIRLSGGPVQIGRKGLYYGTSCLECALSHTDALWPGDVDLILADAVSNVPIAIIELKKHTGRSNIRFADQRLSNYYPYPDGRKYDRLALLAAQLAAESLPIIVLYYSTEQADDDLILERVEGEPGSLQGTKLQQLPMQGRASADLADATITAIAGML